MTLAHLHTLGFDNSSRTGDGRRFYLHVGCSKCQALAINGIPTHETGCPNAMHECRGCNAIIPANQRYCAECA